MNGATDMSYLRKTATYLVQRADGERLFVDEFETLVGPPHDRGNVTSERQFLLRSGQRVSLVDEQTMQLSSGETLIVVDTQ
jgi:hypothetical protein